MTRPCHYHYYYFFKKKRFLYERLLNEIKQIKTILQSVYLIFAGVDTAANL